MVRPRGRSGAASARAATECGLNDISATGAVVVGEERGDARLERADVGAERAVLVLDLDEQRRAAGDEREELGEASGWSRRRR